jgi:hypothetical protein
MGSFATARFRATAAARGLAGCHLLRRRSVFFLHHLLDVFLAHVLFLAFRDLDDGLRGHRAIPRAAFVVQEAKHLSERLGAGRIPEKCARAAGGDQADLAELFQVVRESGSGNVELLLKFPRDHACGMSRAEQANDLQAGLSAEGREAVGTAGNEERIGLGGISMIAGI